MASYTRKAVRGAGIVLVMMSASYALGFVFRLLVARYGESAYGLDGVSAYGLVYAIVGFFGFFSIFMNFGLRSAMVKHIAGFRAKEKPGEVKGTILIVSATTLILSLIICGAVILFSDTIASEFFRQPELSGLIKIYGIGVIFSSVFLSLKNAFIGFQDMGRSSSMEVVKSAITTGLAALLLCLGFFKEDAAILGFAAGFAMVCLVFSPLFLKKTFPAFLKTKAVLTRNLTDRIYRFGVMVAFTDFSGMVLGYTDTLILTYFRTAREVGLYNAAFPTMKLVSVISTAITQVLFPISAELSAKRQDEQLARGLGMIYKYAMLSIFPISLLIFLYPETILGKLFGEEFIPAANILRIFAAGYFLHTFAVVNNTALKGIGRPKDVARITVAGSGVNLVLNLILIPFYGIEGAALADVSGFVTIFVLSTIQIRKRIPIALPWRDFTMIGIAGAVITLVVHLIKSLEFLDVWGKLFFSLAAGAIIYTGILSLSGTLTYREVKDLIKKIR
ncbi:MAG: flippase [Candidatus Altiarchaeota archaeon]|nr:flippase [Candidatus Altiarchaeota archaeon]